jgi:hypothetical protein
MMMHCKIIENWLDYLSGFRIVDVVLILSNLTLLKSTKGKKNQ